MRAPTNLGRGSLGFNMTPMIDVVFLLIIFFLVSSHLAQQEVQLELDLPAAGSGERPDEDTSRRVVVNVLADTPSGPQIKVAGRTLGQKQLQEMIDFESRRSEKPLEVRVRCDRKVPYRVVEPIMVACAKAGVWNLTFAVTRK